MIPPQPSTPAVRLFSPKTIGTSPTSKILHLIRHAEGTHNLCEKDSKLPVHHDAKLTPTGIEQCCKLSSVTKNLEVEAILVSPMTRCLQTATFSFRHALNPTSSEFENDYLNSGDNVSFIAYEEWRETVNYLCDSRRPVDILQTEYPHVDFQYISHNHDPLWQRYEDEFGSYKIHDGLRESNDASGLCKRAQSAWKVLLARPERELALVGHSAFFMHMFTPLFEELQGMVRYEDEEVKELMSYKFENCELRTVMVDCPIPK
jgi:broad specificity phosphatase PhoE